MKKWIAWGLAALLFALSACNRTQERRGKNPSGTPNPGFLGEAPADALVDDCTPGKYGGMLVLATPSNPKTFNPITQIESSTSWVTVNVIYKALVGFDNARQTYVPGLAESWESTPDGLTWTIHLRKGVRWSDGEPFNADDVLFTYQVVSDPKTASATRDLLVQSDDSLPALEKLDDYTLRFQLKEVNGLFLGALGDAMLIPKHKWESAYKAGTFSQSMLISSDPKDIVGLGPYRLESITPDQRIVLERNPYYWKVDGQHHRLPYIDRVMFLVVPNNNTWNLKMESGELDMQQKIYQGIDELKRYEKKADFTVYDLGPGFDIIYAAFNQDPGKDKNGKPFVDPVKLKWFTNVKFRQAIDYAIDRDALVRTVLNGRGVPVYGFDSPANKTWFTDTVSKYPYDPAKARALLKEIGIYDRKGDGTAEDADGHPIKFGLMTNSSNDLKVNTITLIKDNLRKIGIDVELQPIDFNLMQSKLQFTRDFDAVVGTWQSGLPADPIMGKDILLPSGQYYVAHPRQKEPATEWEKRMSDLIQLSSRSNDLAARQKSYWEAMRIWSESLPEIDLAAQDAFVAVTNSIGNSKPSPLENFTYWNIDELYFKY